MSTRAGGAEVCLSVYRGDAIATACEQSSRLGEYGLEVTVAIEDPVTGESPEYTFRYDVEQGYDSGLTIVAPRP